MELRRVAGILPVEEFQLLINIRVFAFKHGRFFEECFAGDGEEFGGHLGGVGIEQGVLAVIHALLKVIEGPAHDGYPACPRHARVQRRQAVGVTAFHVQLVGELMDHHVDAVTVLRVIEP